MEVIVAGAEPVRADVVFVHGLRGDRVKTWQTENVFWPRDLLPQELPNVRIMSYGYDGESRSTGSEAYPEQPRPLALEPGHAFFTQCRLLRGRAVC